MRYIVLFGLILISFGCARQDVRDSDLENLSDTEAQTNVESDVTWLATKTILNANMDEVDDRLDALEVGGGGYTNLTSFVDQSPWRLFYSDGSGDVKELEFGSDGSYLRSNGYSSLPTFQVPSGAPHNAVTLESPSNGLYLSTQQLGLYTANTSRTGALSYTDWNTFNNKQNALTNPLVQADLATTPTDDDTVPPSSGALYDHENGADPHTGYMLESNIGFGANNYLKLSATPGTPDGTKILQDDGTWVDQNDSMIWPTVVGVPFWTSGEEWAGAFTVDTDLEEVSDSHDSIPSALAVDNAYAKKSDMGTLSEDMTEFIESANYATAYNYLAGGQGIITSGLTQDHIYYRTSGSAWADADGNGSGTYPARCYAISTTQCVNSFVYTKTSHGFTIGADLFLSDTAGAISNTPSATNIQKVGWALDANTIIIAISPKIYAP